MGLFMISLLENNARVPHKGDLSWTSEQKTQHGSREGMFGAGGVLLTETDRKDSRERQGNGEGLLCPGILVG